MLSADVDEYWRDKEYKKWVVRLVNSKRKFDQIYVRARTESAARVTGLFHSTLKGTLISVTVRLADPVGDLGGVPKETILQNCALPKMARGQS